MTALSKERLKARIEVLEQASAWIEDQATGASGSDIFYLSENDEDLLCKEAVKLSVKLRNDATKLKTRLTKD